jgi:hypothetical protein
MRAVLLATGEGGEGNALGARRLLPMLPLVDRPFVQHVLEFFAGQGVREFDVVLGQQPEAVERCLGDGGRWGCRVTYHLARDPARPWGVLSRLGLDPHAGGRLLVGHADRLPVVTLPGPTGPGAVLFVSPGGWTGWALVRAADLLAVPRALPAAGLDAHLRSAAGAGLLLSGVQTVLGVRGPAEMLAAQRAVLEGQLGPLVPRAAQREPGVWVARGASVSPAAELVAPVFIGPGCTVVGGSRVGPGAVVAAGCLIDRRCRIRNSSVLADTYVGEGMLLDGAVVDGGLAVNARTSTATQFADPLTLGRAPAVCVSRFVGSAVARLLALALLLAAAPLLLLAAVALLLRRGRAFRTRAVVRLPQPRAEGPWPTCRLVSFGAGGGPLDGLPGLLSVVRGELDFVGVSPRSPDEVGCLPPEWRSLYLRSRAGLVSPAALLGPDPAAEELCAADAAYVVSRSWRQDLRLLAAYLGRAFRPAAGPRFAEEEATGPGLFRRHGGPEAEPLLVK